MKTIRHAFLILLAAGILGGCQEEPRDTLEVESAQETQFTVPDIPLEIASLMEASDIELFRSGPGDRYLNGPQYKAAWGHRGRWHPVLMKLDYHLQFGPVSSCVPGEVEFCYDQFGQPTGAEGCENPGGFSGIASADGYWFRQSLHTEYYPVFCLPTHEGYGQGFYQLEKGLLWYEAENTPFQVDEAGNTSFRRYGCYQGLQSTGVFEGARGWEVMLAFISPENNPANNPYGIGMGEVIVFGWVYY